MKVERLIEDILKPVLRQGRIWAIKGLAGHVLGEFRLDPANYGGYPVPPESPVQRFEAARPSEGFGRVVCHPTAQPHPKAFVGGIGIDAFEVAYWISQDKVRLETADVEVAPCGDQIEVIDLVARFTGNSGEEKGQIVYLAVNGDEVIPIPPRWASLIVKERELILLGERVGTSDVVTKILRYLLAAGGWAKLETLHEYCASSSRTRKGDLPKPWFQKHQNSYKKAISELIKQLRTNRKISSEDAESLEKNFTVFGRTGEDVTLQIEGIVDDDQSVHHIGALANRILEKIEKAGKQDDLPTVGKYGICLEVLRQIGGLRLSDDQTSYILSERRRSIQASLAEIVDYIFTEINNLKIQCEHSSVIQSKTSAECTTHTPCLWAIIVTYTDCITVLHEVAGMQLPSDGLLRFLNTDIEARDKLSRITLRRRKETDTVSRIEKMYPTNVMDEIRESMQNVL